MADIIFPDGTLLKDLVGNRNVFSSDPSTSVGAGEIIYQTTAATLKVNTQTVDPTTNPIWTSVGGGGVTDHGALTGLADDDHTQYYNSVRHTKAIHDALALDHGSLSGLSDDDHTQYLLVNGNRAMTGNLSMSANNVYLDSGILRISNGTGLSGSIGFTTGANNFIQRQLYSGSDYTLLSDQDYMHTWAILGAEKAHLSTADGLKMYTKIDMNGQSIIRANIAGIEGTSFILDQDNIGAGVSSSLRFNRGSTDGDAAIWWDETDDEFQFESDVGVTLADIRVANIAANKVVTGDHGTAATDEVVNVCYGTSATPPTASTTTEGALYIQYTA